MALIILGTIGYFLWRLYHAGKRDGSRKGFAAGRFRRRWR